MKKVLLALILAMTMLFCGCSAKETIASDKQEYIVASIGFDGTGEEIKMIMEAIVVNTDDLSSEKENQLIIGKGKSINEAFSQIISQITQPLSLGHNGITVIGNTVDPNRLNEIFEFCKTQPQLNLATMLIWTESAEELLSCKPKSSVAIGYDIMSMVEVTEEEKGTVFKNRIYEAEALRQKPLKTFWVPYINVAEKGIALGGLAVLKDDKPAYMLKNEEIPLFCLATDSLSRGNIVINGNKIEVRYSRVTYDFSFDNKLKIVLNVQLKATGMKDDLKNETEDLLSSGDICALGNIIYQKEPKIWKKLKDEYNQYYKNADIKVNIYE